MGLAQTLEVYSAQEKLSSSSIRTSRKQTKAHSWFTIRRPIKTSLLYIFYVFYHQKALRISFNSEELQPLQPSQNPEAPAAPPFSGLGSEPGRVERNTSSSAFAKTSEVSKAAEIWMNNSALFLSVGFFVWGRKADSRLLLLFLFLLLIKHITDVMFDLVRYIIETRSYGMMSIYEHRCLFPRKILSIKWRAEHNWNRLDVYRRNVDN